MLHKLFLAIPVFLTLNALASNCSFRPSPTEKDLQEVRQTFKYKGKWINPKLVKEFNPWISDPETPITVAVDIAAADDTNKYFDESTADARGATVTEKAEAGAAAEFFKYEWVGALKNGTSLVQVTEGGGGSGVFVGLLFIGFSLEDAYRPMGDKGKCAQRLPESKKPAEEKYKRLVMHVERTYIVGDRVGAEYRIQGNRVTVNTFAGSKKHSVVLAE